MTMVFECTIWNRNEKKWEKFVIMGFIVSLLWHFGSTLMSFCVCQPHLKKLIDKKIYKKKKEKHDDDNVK